MQTVPWFLSTGFLGGLMAALSGLVTLLVYAVQVGAGTEAFDATRLMTLVFGVVQSAAGVALLVWRVRKGLDPESPEPRIGTHGAGAAGVGAVVGILSASLLFGCGAFVRVVDCPEPAAVIQPLDGYPRGGVVVGTCGGVEVERWTCRDAARMECQPPAAVCVDEGATRRLVVEDADGVVCTRRGTR